MATSTKATPADSAPNSAENIPTEHSLAAPAASLDMPLHWLKPSDFNPRQLFDPEALQELADSIRAHGMIEPIVVREIHALPTAAGVKIITYEIIAGERRYRAAKLAHLETVPVRILTGVDNTEARVLAILENLQRVDLDPIEEARGFAALRDQAGMTQTAIGAAVKRSQPVIAKSLALLKLPDDVLEHIQQGRLSASHGQILTKFADFPTVASAVAADAAARTLPTRALEENPFGNTWTLQNAGVIRRIMGADFDRSVCDACPFGARFVDKEAYSAAYCLKPEHFDELQKAAIAAKERETNAAIQAAHRGGGKVLNLEKVAWDAYQRIHEGSVPAGCTDQCPCRAVGKGHGSATPICTDPKRFKAFETAAKRIARKAERENLTFNLTALLEHLRRSDAITTDMLAALVWPAMRNVSKAAWIASVEQCVPGQLPVKESPAALTRDCLLPLAPADLVRFALHVVVQHELLSHLDQDWHRTETWDFYRKHVPGAVS